MQEDGSGNQHLDTAQVGLIDDGNGRRLPSFATARRSSEMALLNGGRRTAIIRCKVDSNLLAIDKSDFERLLVEDPFLGPQVRKLSHERDLKFPQAP